VPLISAPGMALAKGGSDDENRTEFYGVIQTKPEKGLQGVWIIDEHKLTTDAGTEFNQTNGQLTAGSCAKVHIRNGRVHEIESEPMHDCK
jgi:hypothetical protein